MNYFNYFLFELISINDNHHHYYYYHHYHYHYHYHYRTTHWLMGQVFIGTVLQCGLFW